MSVLQELNDAISKGTPESRLKALWHATDMLLMGRYTESEIWIFGEVIGRLSEEIELAARSQLARRLARSDKAPIQHGQQARIRRFHRCRRSHPSLFRAARQPGPGGERPLAKVSSISIAISRRKSIDEPVTDVLVTRGDQAVVNSVAVNAGARFSDLGLSAI